MNHYFDFAYDIHILIHCLYLVNVLSPITSSLFNFTRVGIVALLTIMASMTSLHLYREAFDIACHYTHLANTETQAILFPPELDSYFECDDHTRLYYHSSIIRPSWPYIDRMFEFGGLEVTTGKVLLGLRPRVVANMLRVCYLGHSLQALKVYKEKYPHCIYVTLMDVEDCVELIQRAPELQLDQSKLIHTLVDQAYIQLHQPGYFYGEQLKWYHQVIRLTDDQRASILPIMKDMEQRFILAWFYLMLKQPNALRKLGMTKVIYFTLMAFYFHICNGLGCCRRSSTYGDVWKKQLDPSGHLQKYINAHCNAPPTPLLRDDSCGYYNKTVKPWWDWRANNTPQYHPNPRHQLAPMPDCIFNKRD